MTQPVQQPANSTSTNTNVSPGSVLLQGVFANLVPAPSAADGANSGGVTYNWSGPSSNSSTTTTAAVPRGVATRPGVPNVSDPFVGDPETSSPTSAIDNVVITESLDAGASNLIGLGGQLRSFTFVAPKYFYNMSKFEFGSFGVIGGTSCGASITASKGIGYFSGIGYWERPSDFFMRTNSYNLGGTIGEASLSFEWTTSGPGFYHFSFGTGLGIGFKTGYRIPDSKNGVSVGGGGSWITAREKPKTFMDSLLYSYKLQSYGINDSISNDVQRKAKERGLIKD